KRAPMELSHGNSSLSGNAGDRWNSTVTSTVPGTVPWKGTVPAKRTVLVPQPSPSLVAKRHDPICFVRVLKTGSSPLSDRTGAEKVSRWGRGVSPTGLCCGIRPLSGLSMPIQGRVAYVGGYG